MSFTDALWFSRKGRTYCTQEILMAHRVGKEFHCSDLHCLDRHVNVGVATDENHG
jgi:hypothetical protein